MQMKHGDKAKGKASKASKTSDKKVSKAVGAKAKASESKGPGKSTAVKASSKIEKSAAKAGSARAPEGNGNRPRLETGDISFGNPIIAAAFKRVAKKYNNAFRRLTD
jgi:hypothetical protein